MDDDEEEHFKDAEESSDEEEHFKDASSSSEEEEDVKPMETEAEVKVALQAKGHTTAPSTSSWVHRRQRGVC